MESPGKILEIKLKEAQMSRKELAQRTGVTEKHICTVINGERGISVSFARKLGYVFEGIGSDYWIRIEAEYEAEQLRLQEENEIGPDEIAVLNHLRDIISYLIECGFMHNECGEASKVLQLRSFLNVSDLTLIPNIAYNAAYRAKVSDSIAVDAFVLFAWQRLCEKQTERLPVTQRLDKDLLREKLPDIKRLMFGEINKGIQSLQILMGECGIAFSVVKNFRGAPVQGFIKPMMNDRLIMCLTIRGKRADIFWFTLFHEIAHVLNGDYSRRFVDFNSVEGAVEKKANEFARDLLIDPQQYKEFVLSPYVNSWNEIERFAQNQDVQPFIVLGRLQNDGILDWSQFSEHVVRYSWA